MSNTSVKKSSIKEILNNEGRLIYSNVGSSMMPLIKQGRDILIIEKPSGRLKKYDVALYRRGSGRYTLHRVIKVLPDSYIICGDNCRRMETGIKDEHIAGVLTGMKRRGRMISMSEIGCRIYAHLWWDIYPVRMIVMAIVKLPVRLFRKIHSSGIKRRK